VGSGGRHRSAQPSCTQHGQQVCMLAGSSSAHPPQHPARPCLAGAAARAGGLRTHMLDHPAAAAAAAAAAPLLPALQQAREQPRTPRSHPPHLPARWRCPWCCCCCCCRSQCPAAGARTTRCCCCSYYCCCCNRCPWCLTGGGPRCLCRAVREAGAGPAAEEFRRRFSMCAPCSALKARKREGRRGGD